MTSTPSQKPSVSSLLDVVFHTIAAIVVYLSILVLVTESAAFGSFFAASMMLYIREVTQYQCKRNACKFTPDSLDPFSWSVQKNLETWVPVVTILGLMVYAEVL